METLQIKPLIEQFGVEKTRLYLQRRFSNPENFWEFASIFAHLMPDAVPDFHRELVQDIMPVGRYGRAAPRGFAKSTVIGLIWLAWLSLNGHRWFVPYISDTHLQAKLIVGGLKAEIETNEILKFVYPNARSKTRWGEEGFVVHGLNHDCYILPLGAGMKIRGLKFENHRPDLIIIDDLENLEAVYSGERRDKLQKWFDYDMEPAMDRYSKHIVYIGTILHYSSLLKQVIDKVGKYASWNTWKYKALKDDGGSLWPARFSTEYLRAMRDDPTHPDYVGSIVFAQEMQNEPQDDQDRIIHMSWLKEYRMSEMINIQVAETDELRKWKWLNQLERVGAFDPAISENQTADNYALYVMGFDKKDAREYQLDLIHGKEKDINKQVTIICDAIVEWKLDIFGIESVFYQKGLYTLVKQEMNRRAIYNCKIVEIKTDKDKIRRARIHSSAFEAGFVHLRTDHKNYAIIKGEIEEFPRGAHDDAFDALMLTREARAKPKARVHRDNPLNNL